jgi:hypothetical protein
MGVKPLYLLDSITHSPRFCFILQVLSGGLTLPAMSNAQQSQIQRLLAKQRQLQELILTLQTERRQVNQELQGANAAAKPRLTQQFVRDVIFPFLNDAGHGGIRARELYHQVKGTGIEVGYDNLRVFLTRSGKQGTIRKMPMLRGPCRWALPHHPSSAAITKEQTRDR